MINKNIRLKILNTLYSKCFEDGYIAPLFTDKILESTFPNVTDFNEFHPHLGYLEDSGLIWGKRRNGFDYLFYIRITELGIDKVESNDIDLCVRHWSTRFKILEWMYVQYYNKQYRINIKDLADALEFNDPKDPKFQIELTYLHEKSILECSYSGGKFGILDIQVKSISFLENLIEKMANSNDPEIKLLSDDLNKQGNEKSKISCLCQWLKNPQTLEIFFKIPQFGRDLGII